MRRTDLENKTIKKINNEKEAYELIQCLNYDECVYVLKNVKNMPTKMVKALVEQGKKEKGLTYELAGAMLQTLVNM